MKSTFKLELKDGFVVTPESLKRICELFETRIGPVAISAECADDVTREFNGLSELKKYSNTKAKRILNLLVRASSSDYRKTGRINFIDEWYFGGTKIEIEARDDVVERLRSEILDVVSSHRPWYNLVAKTDVANLALCLSAGSIIVFLCYAALFAPSKPTSVDMSPRQTAIGYLAMAVMVGICVLLTSVAYLFKRKLFPRASFLIGQEAAHYQIMEKWRWNAVLGFVVSVAAGLLVLGWQAFVAG